jgi:hypothetical protein
MARGQPEPGAQLRAELSQPGPDRAALGGGDASGRLDQAEQGSGGEEAGRVEQRDGDDPAERREDAAERRTCRLAGQLEIESEPGAGTAVSASLPAIPLGESK